MPTAIVSVSHIVNHTYPESRPCPRLCKTLIMSLTNVQHFPNENKDNFDPMKSMQKMIDEYRYCRDQTDGLAFILQQTAEFRHVINKQRKN